MIVARGVMDESKAVTRTRSEVAKGYTTGHYGHGREEGGSVENVEYCTSFSTP